MVRNITDEELEKATITIQLLNGSYYSQKDFPKKGIRDDDSNVISFWVDKNNLRTVRVQDIKYFDVVLDSNDGI